VRNLSLQNRVVLYTGLAHGVVHMVELTYAALLLRIGAEFGQGDFVLGVIANAFAFMFGAGALPAGILVDRLGSRRVMTFGFLFVAVAAFLVALSPNVLVLGLFLGLLGLSIGLYHPAGLSMIAQAAEKRGLAIGYHGVAGNLGVALAPAVAVGLAVAIDWRAAYFFLSGLALVMVVLMRVVQLPDVARRPATASAPVATERAWTAQVVLPLLLVYTAYTLNGFIYRGSFTFLPAHVEQNVHINILGINEGALAGSLTTLALLTGCVGQFLGGTLSQHHALERLAPPVALCLVPALLLMGVTGGLALVGASALFVFVNFTGQPIYNGLIAEYTPQELMGRSYGISFFAAFGLGSSAASFAGFFSQRWGTGSVFLSLAGFALLGTGLTLVILRQAVRRRGLRAPGAVELSADVAAGEPEAGGLR
jgi:predicted MFS family arabinose efflux permease